MADETAGSTGQPDLAVDRLIVGQGLEGTADLGRLARLWRTSDGLTVQEVADRLGLSSSYLRAIERGDRAPSPGTAAGLFEILGAAVTKEGTDEDGARADLVLERHGHRWLVEFKHWTGAGSAILNKPTDSLQTLYWLVAHNLESRHSPDQAEAEAAWEELARYLARHVNPGPSILRDRPGGKKRADMVVSLPKSVSAQQESRPAHTASHDDGREQSSDTLIAHIVRRLGTLDVEALGQVRQLIDQLEAASERHQGRLQPQRNNRTGKRKVPINRRAGDR